MSQELASNDHLETQMIIWAFGPFLRYGPRKLLGAFFLLHWAEACYKFRHYQKSTDRKEDSQKLFNLSY